MKRLLMTLAAVAAMSVFAGPKYVFLFIGDGMSIPQRMTADEFSRITAGWGLKMNSLKYSATTRTCSANAFITDSAAAATAIACGTKTRNGMLGVDPSTNRLESVAEFARATGRKVGIVTSVTICHATPGGFYAHRASRGMSYRIGLDLVASGFDYFAGGGLYGMQNDTNDVEYCGDVFDRAKTAGYRMAFDRKGFDAFRRGEKNWAVFGKNELPFAIDDDGKYPSLPEMVKKGIELLDGDKGFFLMCEGGKLDYAGHANDAATNLRETLMLDEAVGVALAFQKKHPDETLVVVTGDHETGGMAMGFAGSGYSIRLEHLAKQTMSADKFDREVSKVFEEKKNLNLANLRPLITKAFGFKFEGNPTNDVMVLAKEEIAQIEKAIVHDLEFHQAQVAENKNYMGERYYLLGGACKLLMSHKCGLGWSSGSHTAMPVLTTAEGIGAENFTGCLENTDIGKCLKKLLRR